MSQEMILAIARLHLAGFGLIALYLVPALLLWFLAKSETRNANVLAAQKAYRSARTMKRAHETGLHRIFGGLVRGAH